jgi:hypothetical protein
LNYQGGCDYICGPGQPLFLELACGYHP